MGRYVTPSASQGQLVKKQQVFKTSGLFTPSQKLLDAGGVVEVRCVGGGGGGNHYAGGSSGMDITRLVVVTAPVYVFIGAGGGFGTSGGQTAFGTLLTALGGKPATSYTGGASTGEGSLPGENALMLTTNAGIQLGRGGGYGGGSGSSYAGSGVANTGGGGGGNGNYPGTGGSGICIVTWEE